MAKVWTPAMRKAQSDRIKAARARMEREIREALKHHPPDPTVPGVTNSPAGVKKRRKKRKSAISNVDAFVAPKKRRKKHKARSAAESVPVLTAGYRRLAATEGLRTDARPVAKAADAASALRSVLTELRADVERVEKALALLEGKDG